MAVASIRVRDPGRDRGDGRADRCVVAPPRDPGHDGPNRCSAHRWVAVRRGAPRAARPPVRRVLDGVGGLVPRSTRTGRRDHRVRRRRCSNRAGLRRPGARGRRRALRQRRCGHAVASDDRPRPGVGAPSIRPGGPAEPRGVRRRCRGGSARGGGDPVGRPACARRSPGHGCGAGERHPPPGRCGRCASSTASGRCSSRPAGWSATTPRSWCSDAPRSTSCPSRCAAGAVSRWRPPRTASGLLTSAQCSPTSEQRAGPRCSCRGEPVALDVPELEGRIRRPRWRWRPGVPSTLQRPPATYAEPGDRWSLSVRRLGS